MFPSLLHQGTCRLASSDEGRQSAGQGVEGPLPMRRWEGIPLMPWA